MSSKLAHSTLQSRYLVPTTYVFRIRKLIQNYCKIQKIVGKYQRLTKTLEKIQTRSKKIFFTFLKSLCTFSTWNADVTDNDTDVFPIHNYHFEIHPYFWSRHIHTMAHFILPKLINCKSCSYQPPPLRYLCIYQTQFIQWDNATLLERFLLLH